MKNHINFHERVIWQPNMQSVCLPTRKGEIDLLSMRLNFVKNFLFSFYNHEDTMIKMSIKVILIINKCYFGKTIYHWQFNKWCSNNIINNHNRSKS